MIILAAIPFVILSRYAGGWGVPFFSFHTDRGSTCTNDWTGYHCDRVTLDDIRWWGDIHLPDSAVVQRAHYKSTHDFSLDAVVSVPKSDAARTLASTNKTFGACAEHPTRLDTTGLRSVCVRANDATASSEQSSTFADTLYEVTTGIGKDGSLIIGIHEQSR